MSKDKKNSKPIPREESERVVNEALDHAEKTFHLPKEPGSHEIRQILNRATEVHARVSQAVKLVLHTIRESGAYDREATQDMIRKAFQDEYMKWSRDDMVQVTSCLMAGAYMQGVEEYMAGWQTGKNGE